MGFGEWLNRFGRGLGNLAMVPIGLPWDLARSFADREYSIGDAFGHAFSRFGTGLADVGSSLYLDKGLEAAGLGKAVTWTFNQLNMIYDHEFQRQQGSAGLFGLFGAQPGEASISRFGSAVTGTVGSWAPGGAPATLDFVSEYRRNADKGPGTALMDALLINPSMSEEDKASVRASIGYGLGSGVVDAASRWYLQPEVIAGKGLMKLRKRYMFQPTNDWLTRQIRERSNGRVNVEPVEAAIPVVRATESSGRVIVVIPRNQYRWLRRNNPEFVIDESMDATLANPHRTIIMDEINEARAKLVPQISEGGAITGAISETDPAALSAVLNRLDETFSPTGPWRHMRGLWLRVLNGDASASDVIRLIDATEGLTAVLPAERSALLDFLAESVDDAIDARMMGIDYGNLPRSVERPVDNGLRIFFEDEWSKVAQWVDDLAEHYPDNPPIMLELDPNGMHFIGDDYYGLGQPETWTTLEQIKSANVRRVIRARPRSGAFEFVGVNRPGPIPVVGPKARKMASMSKEEFLEAGGYEGHVFSHLRDDTSPLVDVNKGFVGVVSPKSYSLVADNPTFEFVRDGKVTVRMTVFTENKRPVDFILTSVRKSSKNKRPTDVIAVFEAFRKEYPDFNAELLAKRLMAGREKQWGFPKSSQSTIPPISLSQDSASILWSYIRREVRQADRAMAARVKDIHLYDVDGKPIRPDMLVNTTKMTNDQITVMRLMAENDGPVKVNRFLQARELKRRTNTKVNSIQERLASSKSIQAVINWIEGKTPAQIRDRLFRGNVLGDELSTMLSQATTYEERLAILSAGMGVNSPHLFTMEPMLRLRLEKLTKDFTSRIRREEAYVTSEAIEMGMIGPERLQTAIDLEALKEMALKEIAGVNKEIAWSGGLVKLFESRPIDIVPRLTVGGGVRSMALQSSWYQSKLGRPIRSVIEKRAHHHVNLHDPMADHQLVRQLQEAKALGITEDEVQHYRNLYLQAETEQAKLQVFMAAENRIIRLVGKRSGLTRQQIEDLISHAENGRGTVMDFLNSKKYGPGNTDMKVWTDPDTGEAVVLRLPILSTQLANWVPLADVRRLIRVSNKYRRFASNIARAPKEFMDGFYHIWKPTVLLRSGWPLRVVTDEQLRILARTHSLIKHLASIEAGGMPKVPGVIVGKGGFGPRIARLFAKPATVATKAGVAGASLQTRLAKKLGMVDEDWYRYVEEAGLEPLASSRASFGGPSESVLQQYQAILGSHEVGILDHLRSRATGQWQSIGQENPLYRQSWTRALKDQIGRDDMARLAITEVIDGLAKGMPIDSAILHAKSAMLKWLDETPEGVAYSKRVEWWKDMKEEWVENVLVMVGEYTGQFNLSLMEGALSGKITREMLDRVDIASRPQTIHHEIIAQTTGVSGITKFLNDTFAEAFDLLGRLPTDTLSRQPLFRHVYANEMKARYDNMVAQGVEVTERMYQRMSHTSRQVALNDVKTYLYDLAETSRFGNLMRWFMPFYPAWQEVISVWSKLAIADPSIIGRALLLWKAPNRAGLVTTDEDGNEFITLRMSDALADRLKLPESGWARYVATGGVRFGKTSFNLVLNNPLPGSGPVIQIPVNEAVKNKPELEEALKWVLPYGVNTNSLRVAMSPIVGRIDSFLSSHDSDRQYISAFGNAITWLDFQYRAGYRTDPPTYAEARDIADKIFLLRVIGNIGMPAQPIFDSPLKPYYDVWTELNQQYEPDQAEEIFLNQYGPEFFAVTMGRTVSATGIPPTVEAQIARRPVESLIEKYPEYGRLIIGEDSSVGEFSSAAYAWQLTHPIGDSLDPEMERQFRPFLLDPDTGRLEQVDVSLGWIEYIKFLDLLEVERKRRNLPSLRVKEAEDLAELKTRFTENLANTYPAWWRAFNERNELKWQQRIDAFRDLSQNYYTQERSDWDGIRDYLTGRDMILSELNRRKQMGGSASITAQSNSDVRLLWEAMIADILADNIDFVPVYYRYLEGDPLEMRNA